MHTLSQHVLQPASTSTQVTAIGLGCVLTAYHLQRVQRHAARGLQAAFMLTQQGLR